MLLFLILSAVVIGGAYLALLRYYDYWKNRNVPHLPVSFLFGNFGKSLILKKTFGQVYDEIYKRFPNLPYVGYYNMREPGLVIRDPELIEEVLVKKFNHFHDNEFNVKNEADDPLSARDPFFAVGEKWKLHRNRIAPALTSRQIENMFPTFAQIGDDLVKYLKDNEKFCVNGKDLALKYTCDCIATSAFGLEAHSFEDSNSKFQEMGKALLSPSILHVIRFFLLMIVPKLAKIMKVKFVVDEAGNYFRNIISQTIKYRKKNKIIRNDFLDLMINLKEKHNSSEFTDEDITGYSLTMYVDGFETSGITIHFVLYDLGSNLHVQNQLRNYIRNILSKNSEGLTFGTLQEMKFLDQIISETLRIHPPGFFMTKLCTKECNFPSLDNPEKELMIELGTKITIPFHSLHLDEKYFPNPTQYDPERFSEKNKDSIHKFAYLPFGSGPRMCIGQKLAMLQIKMAITKLILNFEIRVNGKTKTPLEIDPLYILNAVKGGIWFDFYPINENQ